jgi:aminomethyltransferase
MQKTCLYQSHVDLKAKIVPFYGWQLPVQFSSVMAEHEAVRHKAGIFDVSHMQVIDLFGADAMEFLQWLTVTDLSKKQPSNGLFSCIYTCFLNPEAGIIDDLIVCRQESNRFRIVTNAGTREKVLNHLKEKSGEYDVEIKPLENYGMIAVQGPEAEKNLKELIDIPQLASFEACFIGDDFLSRTGYTGEDGFEVIASQETIQSLWRELIRKGVLPCGLAARDTLRMEAGMNLYGADMDETIRPDQCGLNWVISTNKEFIGKESLLNNQAAAKIDRLGIVLDEPGVLRAGVEVFDDDKPLGVVTSGGFSPSLKKSIGFARVDLSISNSCQVSIRGKKLNASLCKLPFYKKGQGQIILRGES